MAYKLLINDRAKFTALLVGITIAVFLMVTMTSMFAGALNRSSSTVINIGAKMWVMDPAVQTVANTIGIPDYTLDAVRRIQGVKYAVPLFSGGALVRLENGTYQAVNVVGFDDTSLFGRPEMEQGHIEDIFAENSFMVVHNSEFGKLGNPPVRRVSPPANVLMDIAKLHRSPFDSELGVTPTRRAPKATSFQPAHWNGTVIWITACQSASTYSVHVLLRSR